MIMSNDGDVQGLSGSSAIFVSPACCTFWPCRDGPHESREAKEEQALSGELLFDVKTLVIWRRTPYKSLSPCQAIASLRARLEARAASAYLSTNEHSSMIDS